jgi:hypothetical protein
MKVSSSAARWESTRAASSKQDNYRVSARTENGESWIVVGFLLRHLKFLRLSLEKTNAS